MTKTQTQLSLEDLILFSRSLSLEEKQQLIKRLDTWPTDKKEQLRAILQKEFDSLKALDDMALRAVQAFSADLKSIAAALPQTQAA